VAHVQFTDRYGLQVSSRSSSRLLHLLQSDQYHVLAASHISSTNSAARFRSDVCLNVMYLVKYSSCYWAFSPLVSLEENKQAELTELTVIVAVPDISRLILYQSQLGYFLVIAHPVHCNCFDQFHFHR